LSTDFQAIGLPSFSVPFSSGSFSGFSNFWPSVLQLRPRWFKLFFTPPRGRTCFVSAFASCKGPPPERSPLQVAFALAGKDGTSSLIFLPCLKRAPSIRTARNAFFPPRNQGPALPHFCSAIPPNPQKRVLDTNFSPLGSPSPRERIPICHRISGATATLWRFSPSPHAYHIFSSPFSPISFLT